MIQSQTSCNFWSCLQERTLFLLSGSRRRPTSTFAFCPERAPANFGIDGVAGDIAFHPRVYLLLYHVRWVHRYYAVANIFARTIVKVIKDTLVRVNLGLTKFWGQCYQGVNTVSGLKSGVAKQLRGEEPRGLYFHCHGHALYDSEHRLSVFGQF